MATAIGLRTIFLAAFLLMILVYHVSWTFARGSTFFSKKPPWITPPGRRRPSGRSTPCHQTSSLPSVLPVVGDPLHCSPQLGIIVEGVEAGGVEGVVQVTLKGEDRVHEGLAWSLPLKRRQSRTQKFVQLHVLILPHPFVLVTARS